jgi:hypothetical protein
MDNGSSGFYYYIDELVREEALDDSFLNKAINDKHHSYCFIIHPTHFFKNPTQYNIHLRKFFHGLKFHNHHFSVEEKFQYESDIHYTCCFVNPNNEQEKLKFSVFFNKDTNKITRINYRYTNHQIVIKDDISLKAALTYDLSKLNRIFQPLDAHHESFTLDKLIKMAKTTWGYRIETHIEDYKKELEKLLKKFQTLQSNYEKVLKVFNESKPPKIYIGSFAIQHLDALNKYYQSIAPYMDSHKRPYSLKGLQEIINQLKNDLFFISFGNLELLLKEMQGGYPQHTLAPYLIDSHPKTEDDLMQSIQTLYQESILSGNLAFVKAINAQFLIDVNYQALSKTLIEKIETQDLPLRKDLIAIAHFMYQTQLTYRNSLKSHCKETRVMKAHQQFIVLDLLSKMFLEKNFEAFCMYVDQGALKLLPEECKPLETIPKLAQNDEESKPYFQYLQKV